MSARMLYFNTTTAACQNRTGSFRPLAEVALVESAFTRYSQKEVTGEQGGIGAPKPKLRIIAAA